MSNPTSNIKGFSKILNRMANTPLKQRRMATALAGGIAGASSTPTKENGTNTENFTRKALGGVSGAVLGHQAGKLLTNNNISNVAAKTGNVANSVHSKIMDSKMNDKVKNVGMRFTDRVSRNASKVNKAFETIPTTTTPSSVVMNAKDVDFYSANQKRSPIIPKLLPAGKSATASDFVDYLFEKVASEELNNQEFVFKKKA